MMCAALPAPDAERLAKVCGLLASNHDGERANAAAAATRLLEQYGISWPEFVRCRAALPRPATGDHRARAARLLAEARTLSPWERQFLASIARRPAPLSPKQAAVLERLEQDRAA
jgi:hypothetical protein